MSILPSSRFCISIQESVEIGPCKVPCYVIPSIAGAIIVSTASSIALALVSYETGAASPVQACAVGILSCTFLSTTFATCFGVILSKNCRDINVQGFEC